MEGPTPVSALIHAATMVTAGVYLLIRTSPLIEYSDIVLLICLWLGSITTMSSSLIGFFQEDIKKIIAYSTMSQLAREYNIFIIFRHQTICVEVIFNIINSQITKAHIYFNSIYISNNFINSFIKLI
jgi:NADH-ubiquinone oxidoreductase chain 5